MQLKILKSEYQKGSEWSKEKIARVSKVTGLSESQVYKWCWDQKKKEGDTQVRTIDSATHNLPLPCKENISLSKLESSFKPKKIQMPMLGLPKKRKMSITLKLSLIHI